MKANQLLKRKILSPETLPTLLEEWRKNGEKIVFSNGCFDLLHMGHVEYLSKASEFGTKLIIGLNTDASVQRLKGPSRPINNEQARAQLLASLFFVDAVVLFDEDTPYNLIKKIAPNVLVKGSDYKAEDIVGYDILKANGGEVKTVDLVDGYSSSRIIELLNKG